jgi:hypothetical protein
LAFLPKLVEEHKCENSESLAENQQLCDEGNWLRGLRHVVTSAHRDNIGLRRVLEKAGVTLGMRFRILWSKGRSKKLSSTLGLSATGSKRKRGAKDMDASLKIAAVETISVDDFPNLCCVRIHTDGGIVGLGETFFGPEAVATHIHAVASWL